MSSATHTRPADAEPDGPAAIASSLLARIDEARRLAEALARLVAKRSIADEHCILCYPGLEPFWLTPPQAAVVRRLVDAYVSSAGPDVPEKDLVAASGLDVRRLADVFRGPLGTLVIPGSRKGTFRVAEPVSPSEMAARAGRRKKAKGAKRKRG